jgi:hypothetical protein
MTAIPPGPLSASSKSSRRCCGDNRKGDDSLMADTSLRAAIRRRDTNVASWPDSVNWNQVAADSGRRSLYALARPTLVFGGASTNFHFLRHD